MTERPCPHCGTLNPRTAPLCFGCNAALETGPQDDLCPYSRDPCEWAWKPPAMRDPNCALCHGRGDDGDPCPFCWFKERARR